MWKARALFMCVDGEGSEIVKQTFYPMGNDDFISVNEASTDNYKKILKSK